MSQLRRFLDIIRSETGQPLREELAKSPAKIIMSAFPVAKVPSSEDQLALSGPTVSGGIIVPSNENYIAVQSATASPVQAPMQTLDVQFQGIALVSSLVKLLPDWLFSNRQVFDALVRLWQSPERVSRLRNEQNLTLNQVSTRPQTCFGVLA